MCRFLLILILLLQSGCTNFLFVPYRPLPVTPDVAGIAYEDIYITMSDGVRLHGWRLIAKGEKRGTILFFHGNGDNVSTQLPTSSWLPEQGYDVYVVDYRGYGRSDGKPELDAVINDMGSVIGFVIGRLPEDEKLIIVGHSLGASMAIYAVAHSTLRERIKALVTIEAFSDYHDITRDVLSQSWLFWLFQWPLSYTVDNTYRPLDAIALVSPVPVLILHSKSDEMIDIYHAERLYQAASPPKTFELIDSDHNNIFSNDDNRMILLDYLTKLHESGQL